MSLHLLTEAEDELGVLGHLLGRPGRVPGELDLDVLDSGKRAHDVVDLLRGVRFLADSARTHSLLMCTRCNWVRFVDGIHFFARERREEVRLLG